MRRNNFCREMEKRVPLRGPIWTLGGCALYWVYQRALQPQLFSGALPSRA